MPSTPPPPSPATPPPNIHSPRPQRLKSHQHADMNNIDAMASVHHHDHQQDPTTINNKQDDPKYNNLENMEPSPSGLSQSQSQIKVLMMKSNTSTPPPPSPSPLHGHLGLGVHQYQNNMEWSWIHVSSSSIPPSPQLTPSTDPLKDSTVSKNQNQPPINEISPSAESETTPPQSSSLQQSLSLSNSPNRPPSIDDEEHGNNHLANTERTSNNDNIENENDKASAENDDIVSLTSSFPASINSPYLSASPYFTASGIQSHHLSNTSNQNNNDGVVLVSNGGSAVSLYGLLPPGFLNSNNGGRSTGGGGGDAASRSSTPPFAMVGFGGDGLVVEDVSSGEGNGRRQQTRFVGMSLVEIAERLAMEASIGDDGTRGGEREGHGGGSVGVVGMGLQDPLEASLHTIAQHDFPSISRSHTSHNHHHRPATPSNLPPRQTTSFNSPHRQAPVQIQSRTFVTTTTTATLHTSQTPPPSYDNIPTIPDAGQHYQSPSRPNSVNSMTSSSRFTFQSANGMEQSHDSAGNGNSVSENAELGDSEMLVSVTAPSPPPPPPSVNSVGGVRFRGSTGAGSMDDFVEDDGKERNEALVEGGFWSIIASWFWDLDVVDGGVNKKNDGDSCEMRKDSAAVLKGLADISEKCQSEEGIRFWRRDGDVAKWRCGGGKDDGEIWNWSLLKIVSTVLAAGVGGYVLIKVGA
ncbi:hypothetical protein HDU76_001349, partial [Blyttiomyces sp. JEL0837]